MGPTRVSWVVRACVDEVGEAGTGLGWLALAGWLAGWRRAAENTALCLQNDRVIGSMMMDGAGLAPNPGWIMLPPSSSWWSSRASSHR